MTKSELVEMLSDYQDNAQVIFNCDEHYKALSIDHISFLDGEFIPDLKREKPCPKIIIHLKEKKNI